MSLIWQESRGKQNNLTQITNIYWFRDGIKELGFDDVKNNEYQNVILCAHYLKQWSEEFGCMACALQAWNEGYENSIKNHKRNCKNHSYYARSIMKRSQKWEQKWYASQRRIRP